MQKCNDITEKYNSQINSIKAHMPMAGNGPHSKRQRHGDEVSDHAAVMDNADALRHNRDDLTAGGGSEIEP
eukprot:2726763-Ditylum_brightwellii.AAC.1